MCSPPSSGTWPTSSNTRPRESAPRNGIGDMITAVIILGLILANGLFVAAEFAIVATPPTSIDRLAHRGHRAARHVARILHEPRLQDRYIATAQLGISAASLALGMYGEKKVATSI